ncbi:alpha-xenorhabdolysin family binary toxin subunit A [Pseudomonas mucidolens]|uniref:alpha-xenorhabdolysin family binary toxin subunit A n=1 Tax=Pseudomonas mucidolens TaxID=46679 RepID=UPI0009FCD765|nr:alpha-xenorhabdolysin family binary toxin subunit A [Pseudomonas mucidolens]SQH36537.1 binary cytotoxin component [Pseudomonas mucidolens]
MERSAEYPIPIVTRDDVRVIERYVAQGQILPLTEDDVHAKYSKYAPATLTREIMQNFRTINTHAQSWQDVQDAMITVSAVLVAFSKDLHEYGDEAVEVIKDMKGYRTNKIDSMTEAQIRELPSISFDGDEQRQMESVEVTVDYIRKSIRAKKADSGSALERLNIFRDTLTNEIEPWIGQMIKVSNPDALDTAIAESRIELVKIKNNIVQMNAPKSNWGLLMDLTNTLHITNTLNDQEMSDSVRAQHIKRREDALKKLESNNQLRGMLQTLYVGMGSLYDVVDPAIKAVTQLHGHWENILALIEDSLAQFRRESSYAYLGLFVIKLERVLQDWSHIENNSTTLQNAFRL